MNPNPKPNKIHAGVAVTYNRLNKFSSRNRWPAKYSLRLYKYGNHFQYVYFILRYLYNLFVCNNNQLTVVVYIFRTEPHWRYKIRTGPDQESLLNALMTYEIFVIQFTDGHWHSHGCHLSSYEEAAELATLQFNKWSPFSCLYIPYSAKRWQGKTLANLANPEPFAKVLPIQICIIKLRA